MMGPPGSQKNRLTLRGHTTKSSLTPQCQTSLLCDFEAQDTEFLECLNNRRSAHTPPTSADPAPQIYFPEGGEWAQQPLKKLIFYKKTPRTHLLTLMSQPTCELILPLSGTKCKSQMLEKKGSHVHRKKLVITQPADFCNMLWHHNVMTYNNSHVDNNGIKLLCDNSLGDIFSSQLWEWNPSPTRYSPI